MTESTSISTHVLDTAFGAPAADITVTLLRVDAHGDTTILSSHVTTRDGRVGALAPDGERLRAGRYRLCFDVASYFAADRRESFYNEICIDFKIGETPQHYHVPLLLSPYGYSTYRGS